MPIAYPDILSLKSDPKAYAWTVKDSALYALGVGMAADPLNEAELDFVYEKAIKSIPTQAGVVAWGALPGDMGLNFALLVDGERRIVFHRPLPPSGSVNAACQVTGVWDKGAGKGAVVAFDTELSDPATGALLQTLTTTFFARGDGGFGGPSEGQPEPHPIPSRAPDVSLDLATRPDQALLYRLSGEYNPLHADPAFAKMVGFPRPILHGMCTYGVTCRAVLQTYADYDPTRIKSHQARFSAPVFPGETITVDLWRDDDVVSFEARVQARGVTVIKNGKTVLG